MTPPIAHSQAKAPARAHLALRVIRQILAWGARQLALAERLPALARPTEPSMAPAWLLARAMSRRKTPASPALQRQRGIHGTRQAVLPRQCQLLLPAPLRLPFQTGSRTLQVTRRWLPRKSSCKSA